MFVDEVIDIFILLTLIIIPLSFIIGLLRESAREEKREHLDFSDHEEMAVEDKKAS